VAGLECVNCRPRPTGDFRVLSNPPQRADRNVAQHYPCQEQPLNLWDPNALAILQFAACVFTGAAAMMKRKCCGICRVQQVYYILASCCTVLFNSFCRLCFRLRAALLYVGFHWLSLHVSAYMAIFKCVGYFYFHMLEDCFRPLQHCDRGFESHWGMDVCVCSVCVFSVST
jgi:hypothetical protein